MVFNTQPFCLQLQNWVVTDCKFLATIKCGYTAIDKYTLGKATTIVN